MLGGAVVEESCDARDAYSEWSSTDAPCKHLSTAEPRSKAWVSFGAVVGGMGTCCGSWDVVEVPATPRGGGEWKAPGGPAGGTTRGGEVGGGGGTRAPASKDPPGELGGIVESGPLFTGESDAGDGCGPKLPGTNTGASFRSLEA